MTFDEWFVLLEDYARQNGHAVPLKRYVVGGHTLGRWVRHLLTDRPPTDDQHDRLVALPGWQAAEVRSCARQLLGPAEPAWQDAGAVLMAALHVGGDPAAIAGLLGLDMDATIRTVERLLHERLWTQEDGHWVFRYPWLDTVLDENSPPGLASIGFALQVMVALGDAQVSKSPDGELLYRSSDFEPGPAQLGPEVGDGAMVGGRPGNEPELPTRPQETVVPAVGPLDGPPLLLGGSG